MTRRDEDRYEIDPVDGLKREIIGEWSTEKHERLRRYVDITCGPRRKFSNRRNAYIDLYCATGRARIRDTDEVVPGSAVIAATSQSPPSGFQTLFLGDIDREHLDACSARVRAAGAMQDIVPLHGPSEVTASSVVRQVDKYGLHFALLDPYNISTLPFAVIQTLSEIPRLDFLVHVSESDLQRNIIGKGEFHKLDAFAPGWEKTVDPTQPPHIVKMQILRAWRGNIEALGFKVSDNVERVRGTKNQPLYWLLLASRHDLADKFWKAVSNVGVQRSLL